MKQMILLQTNSVFNRVTLAGVALMFFGVAAVAQQLTPGDPIQPGTIANDAAASPTQSESKRIFFIIPNYRTSPTLEDFHPLTASEKFKIASEDALDRGTVVLAAIFGGEGQLANSNRSFGQGAAGFGRYFGAAYGDYFIGDYMTEAAFPFLLHQDPRYFRRGTGTKWSRLGYAMGQIVWTHGDSGKTQFNFSEVIGNSTAVAISNAYYSDNRTASDNVSKLGMQLGVDMAANVLKEFWPDIERKFGRKSNREPIAKR
ncbi:MAG TPA: hypothetical protein VHZ07_11600 [Bryobacteraceae bacterium]|jgi:hypothetical protein|nr:hypothetical protein [Bryobacteraceae bacterium]